MIAARHREQNSFRNIARRFKALENSVDPADVPDQLLLIPGFHYARRQQRRMLACAVPDHDVGLNAQFFE